MEHSTALAATGPANLCDGVSLPGQESAKVPVTGELNSTLQSLHNVRGKFYGVLVVIFRDSSAILCILFRNANCEDYMQMQCQPQHLGSKRNVSVCLIILLVARAMRQLPARITAKAIVVSLLFDLERVNERKNTINRQLLYLINFFVLLCERRVEITVLGRLGEKRQEAAI
ncbi:hypothetical protein MGYG_00482 [Nannizzia gypsea CBS 118893]|uniref:Uncharacterized protein n=1 Tax=Arthroderma gypseum (strain ATCC MYA-4604 / CBS 118893) TaxID=535722 RepID=E5QZX8_ARTGP|nr:hypothetical protein MGYG_00482 [Nannizzia gypsea CBS 118893]EFQ97441.1 hypothetical protein MGYG_00482 [Nannizzia gypsea CBS 118893]